MTANTLKNPSENGNSTSVIAANDNISRLLLSDKNLVPNLDQGSDRFFDLITCNIKFFNDRDPKRVSIITSILEELNTDIFVFQEIEESFLDIVAQNLTDVGAGLYKVAYGTTRGERVAIMYDMECVKASEDIKELFADENLTVDVNLDEKKELKKVTF